MAASTVPSASIEAFTVASALVASVSQAGVAAAVGVVSAAAGPICGKTVPAIFFVF
jgi:hypothetical protein